MTRTLYWICSGILSQWRSLISLTHGYVFLNCWLHDRLHFGLSVACSIVNLIFLTKEHYSSQANWSPNLAQSPVLPLVLVGDVSLLHFPKVKYEVLQVLLIWMFNLSWDCIKYPRFLADGTGLITSLPIMMLMFSLFSSFSNCCLVLKRTTSILSSFILSSFVLIQLHMSLMQASRDVLHEVYDMDLFGLNDK